VIKHLITYHAIFLIAILVYLEKKQKKSISFITSS